jgi:hypothetical protein
MMKFYGNTTLSDEMVFQTILGNSHFKIKFAGILPTPTGAWAGPILPISRCDMSIGFGLRRD